MNDTAAIQSRHFPVKYPRGTTECEQCGQNWPCDARVEGDRADRAERERDALRRTLDEVIPWGSHAAGCPGFGDCACGWALLVRRALALAAASPDTGSAGDE